MSRIPRIELVLTFQDFHRFSQISFQICTSGRLLILPDVLPDMHRALVVRLQVKESRHEVTDEHHGLSPNRGQDLGYYLPNQKFVSYCSKHLRIPLSLSLSIYIYITGFRYINGDLSAEGSKIRFKITDFMLRK